MMFVLLQWSGTIPPVSEVPPVFAIVEKRDLASPGLVKWLSNIPEEVLSERSERINTKVSLTNFFPL